MRARVGLRVLAACCLLLVLGGCVAAPTGGGGTAGPGDSDLRFRPAADAVGLNYSATTARSINGNGGVYAADYDNDGDEDLLVLGGSGRYSEYSQLPSHPGLYRNNGSGFVLTGTLESARFENRSFVGALWFDYDTDGWTDLLLLPRDGRSVFLRNDGGTLRVTRVGLEANLSVPFSASAADYDGDGRPDVFVAQNGNWQDTTPKGFYEPNRSIEDDNGAPNLLFRWNESRGEYVRATDAGIEGTRWSLATSFVDLTGDGRPDVHVANDYNHDYLYVNEGDGTFRQVKTGSATNRNGMSSEVADVDGDGRLDVFVTNIYFNRSRLDSEPIQNYLRLRLGKRTKGNNLLVNRGDGSFVDRADEYGVRKGGWGWAAVVADFDNDGDRDLFHTTKMFSREFWKSHYTRYDVLAERTGPEQFRIENASGYGFRPADGRGVASLDYDRDGDLDLAVSVYFTGRYQFYENVGADRGDDGWLQVDVEPGPNQTALGARVYVTADNRTRLDVRNAKADYLSQDTRVLHFGLGDSHRVQKLRVVWPDGHEAVWTGVPADRRVIVAYNGTLRTSPAR
jgi:hypothetical protein